MPETKHKKKHDKKSRRYEVFGKILTVVGILWMGSMLIYILCIAIGQLSK